MKNKYVLLIIILFIVILLFCIFKIRKKEEVVEITKIKSFYLSYSQGYSINANIHYELAFDNKDNKYKAKIKPYGISEEDQKEIIVDEKVMEQITHILKEYHVEKWNGFDKTDKNVLDGDSFYLSVRMFDGESISASGYMMWPENYRIVRDKVSKIFMDLYMGKEV